MTDLTLAVAVEQLYGQSPTEFIATRGELVKQAKSANDKPLADQIAALRRPTQAAWLLNLLARQPESLQRLTDVGRRLREAQSSLDAAAMKTLASERNTVIASVVADAIGDHEVSAATREQLNATCIAAVADPAAQDALCSGQLVTALQYSGFGEVDLGDALATPLRLVPRPVDAAPAKQAKLATSSSPPRQAPAAQPAPAKAPKAVAPPRRDLKVAQKRLAAADRELASAEAALAAAHERLKLARAQHSAAEAALQKLNR